MPPLNSHTSALSAAQVETLREILRDSGFEFGEKPYAIYHAAKPHLSITVYEKGPKVVVQGKETEDFVKFQLEPKVLEEARLGYEEVHHPDRFRPHFGIDESGKGDFFGPLVIAGYYADSTLTRRLVDLGVQDSKRIGSDARIRALAAELRKLPGAAHQVVSVGPDRYNQLVAKMGNVNRLLAWGHARVIENLLEQRPDCPEALSDQFANPKVLERSLLAGGRTIRLRQQTKAESDPAVAAASILARAGFIDWLDKEGRQLQTVLPRGASAAVKEIAKALVAGHGPEILRRLAKVHFRTSHEIAPDIFPPPPPKTAWQPRKKNASP